MRTDTDIQHDLDHSADELRRLRLRHMQLAALALLVAAGVLLAISHALRAQHPAWGYVAAFAEAAMVGAIADWFAVVALFRHPMGLPIWHTAIIPQRKDEIGRNLGSFVENHFITEAAITGKIRQANPTARIGAWLTNSTHAATLSRAAAVVTRQLVETLDHAQLRDSVRALASQRLEALDLSGAAGQLVDSLMHSGQHQELLWVRQPKKMPTAAQNDTVCPAGWVCCETRIPAGCISTKTRYAKYHKNDKQKITSGDHRLPAG